MKKGALRLLLLSLLMIQFSCGGGDGSSSSGSYRSTVSINLGQTRTASPEPGTILKESAQIPAAVASIRFTISAPDMEMIQRVVAVAGRTTITESFDVPVGSNRRFLVEALDSGGNVIFRGEVFADVGQQPLSLTITTVNTDPIAPLFQGLTNVTGIGATSLVLNWSAASDNASPQSQIQYLVFMSTTSGGEDFSTPTFTTTAGVTSYTVTGLNPSTTYYFVVRAKDEHGNQDSNNAEKAAAILAAADTTPPAFGGLSSAVSNPGLLAVDLSWSLATDNVTPPANIVYLIYIATTSGRENLSSPAFTTSAGATSYRVTGLIPGATYFFVVRAKDEAGNVDTNTVEQSAVFPDTTPPSFRGLISAVSDLELSSIDLSWSPATDNVTPSANMVYLIYISKVKGGENFSSPTFTTSAGVTSYRVTGLNPGATYFFVVRARDQAGNVDTNTVEQSATFPFTDLSISNVNTGDGLLFFNVLNSGGLAANDVQVFVLIEFSPNLTFCQSQTPVSVPAGGSVHFSGIYVDSAISYKIIVDPDNLLPSESNRTNNIYCSDSTDSLCHSPTPTTCVAPPS